MINEAVVEQFMEQPVLAHQILGSSFEQFIRFFHWYMYHNEFIFKPFHITIIHKLEDIVFGRNKKKNLMITIPPRWGKSSIMKYFCAWSYLINPASNCIYTSYSDELATSFSKDIREIVESPAFKAFSGIKLNRAKTGADYWATEQGGGFRAAPVAGSITGFGCFSYNTKVKTELGDMKIGDIVSHKTPVKFKSYNWETNEIEYKKPCRFIKNERQEFLRIITNDGAIIDCSTDHNFYTDKGIVRADELTTESVLPSNSLDNVSTYSKFFGNFLARMVFIADKLSLFVSGNVFVNRGLISSNSNPFCFPRPIKSSLNVCYVRRSYSIILFYLLISARVCCNLFCLLYRNLMIPIMRSVSNAILFVAGLRTIRKIFNKIIGRIPIKMSHNHSICSLANKSLCNKRVNSSVFPFSVFRKVCDKISFCCFPKRNHPVHPNASYSANRRNLVQSFIFRDRKPLFIYRIGHFNSFCVTIPHNHNIFLACRQEVLVRNCGVSGDEYGGALIMDDMLKSSNVKSQAEMQNGIDYYLNTLKSRANNQSKTPFILIMQRLALEDLAGYIQENEKEDWDIVKVQALNEETGEAIWPEKFSAQDLLKLKKLSPFVFYGQYQQEPIVIGGSVYKTEWFKFYNPNEHYDYQLSFITADTAQKKGEGNDFTVFQMWGKTFDNRLHLIDMVRGKFDAQELREQVKLFWRKCQSRTDCVAPYGFYIEDKSSGIGVIQEIKKTDPIPVIPIQRNRHKDEKGQWVSMDKFSRAMTAIPYIANGWVYLPSNEKDRISSELLAEAAAFKADLSAKHDDMCFVGETLIATTKGNKRLDQITKEDKVITPFGIGKILGISKREADVISNIGLTGTPDHKILCCHDYMFDKLKNMMYDNASKLTLKDLLRWKRQSLYYSMAESIIVANRKDISQLHTITKTGKVAEDFIEMFGNFIQERKYLKAITFTTKTGIGSIMILKILFVYHLKNIINNILMKLGKFGKDRICKKQEDVEEKNVKSGTIQKKQRNGTRNIRKNTLKKFLSLLNVMSAEKRLIHSTINEEKTSATSAEIENCTGSLDKRKKIVYNLKIDKGCYYANGILVSNCDALNDAIDIAFGATGLSSIFI